MDSPCLIPHFPEGMSRPQLKFSVSVARLRKNALFAGSDEGGENWAAVASLIETCKLNGVDLQRYLTGLLTRLVNG